MGLILVVEDDATVREVVVSYLRAAGHDVREEAEGRAALRVIGEERPEVVVLDLMLPGLDGREICRRLRAGGNQVPILMLSALGAVEDRLTGLELGADDYLTKPFSARELVLRVEALLRRAQQQRPALPDLIEDGDLRIDRVSRTVTRHGVPVALTQREFDLLHFLAATAGQAHTRDHLLQQVWGWSVGGHSTVTVHVRRVREKIEPVPEEPTRLVTVWGVGYRWEVAP
ncbi:response regulator transcription factor [Nocardioides sp.]|uniref:response regulator transcription factor n=1 Tax=Nocardioides sp. TaxID=35761 RepID=UPI003513D205